MCFQSESGKFKCGCSRSIWTRQRRVRPHYDSASVTSSDYNPETLEATLQSHQSQTNRVRGLLGARPCFGCSPVPGKRGWPRADSGEADAWWHLHSRPLVAVLTLQFQDDMRKIFDWSGEGWKSTEPFWHHGHKPQIPNTRVWQGSYFVFCINVTCRFTHQSIQTTHEERLQTRINLWKKPLSFT